MNQNTFECALRFLVILYAKDEMKTENELVAYDYIATYAQDFGVADYNLNGENVYRDSEYFTRKSIAPEAIKMLVLRGFINVDGGDGFRYYVTEKGKQVVNNINGAYLESYLELVHKTLNRYEGFDESQIIKVVERFLLEDQEL